MSTALLLTNAYQAIRATHNGNRYLFENSNGIDEVLNSAIEVALNDFEMHACIIRAQSALNTLLPLITQSDLTQYTNQIAIIDNSVTLFANVKALTYGFYGFEGLSGRDSSFERFFLAFVVVILYQNNEERG